MAGFDPSIFTNKDTGILNDPAVLLQTLGAITPGISRGTTRLRPGIALNVLGQAYGDVRQQNMLQQLTNRFTEPYRQPFQMLPSAERAETETETEQPTPEERFKAILKPPVNFAQLLGTLSPQESRAFVRSMGPQGFGLAGLGQTGTLENIWKTSYGQAVDERQMKLSQLAGEALNTLRDDPLNTQAREMLTKAMPLLRSENQGIVREQMKDIEVLGSRLKQVEDIKKRFPNVTREDALDSQRWAIILQRDEAWRVGNATVDAIEASGESPAIVASLRKAVATGAPISQEFLTNSILRQQRYLLYNDPRFRAKFAMLENGIPLDQAALNEIFATPEGARMADVIRQQQQWAMSYRSQEKLRESLEQQRNRESMDRDMLRASTEERRFLEDSRSATGAQKERLLRQYEAARRRYDQLDRAYAAEYNPGGAISGEESKFKEILTEMQDPALSSEAKRDLAAKTRQALTDANRLYAGSKNLQNWWGIFYPDALRQLNEAEAGLPSAVSPPGARPSYPSAEEGRKRLYEDISSLPETIGRRLPSVPSAEAVPGP